jgi:hypothetical protein
VFLSILEFSRHEIRIAHGLTIMICSLSGWEAFPTHGAFNHTRIIWAFSPSAPQVRGPPCAHGISGISYGEVRDNAYVDCKNGVISWSSLYWFAAPMSCYGDGLKGTWASPRLLMSFSHHGPANMFHSSSIVYMRLYIHIGYDSKLCCYIYSAQDNLFDYKL